ncbi:uncharacterized protein LOC122278558 [Carya illinoinensis]|uniref:uncharacterized protein LOC122278558 n=1 Tax=Carya illinoinensis TaxID=32201 RepID=UPI001C71D3F0|nr:uncharacterized protein LOC122278558 [Carya illinoinensis]
MSILFGKAWHKALSVDDRLRRVGIPIVSKCDCCCVGHYEDINHVLFEGDFPRKIWLTFSNLFGLPMGRNWEQHVSSWFRRAKSSSQVGYIVGLMPVIITWRLWRQRCLARMEGSLESYDMVIKSISFWVRSLGLMGEKFHTLSRFDGMILEALCIRPMPLKERTCKVVQWHKSPLGWFKLNTNGSSLGNPGSCGTGGVIRHATGQLVKAFASPSGMGSNNKAELLALLYGLRECTSLHLSNVIVEVDSMVIISWWHRGHCGVWYLEDYWDEIVVLAHSINCKFQHVLREGNKVADWLAKAGAVGVSSDYSNTSSMPRVLRGLIRLDLLGIPSIRCC